MFSKSHGNFFATQMTQLNDDAIKESKYIFLQSYIIW